MSGAGQKALLDFPGIRKVLVSLSVFQQTHPGIRKVLVSLSVFQQTHLWPHCEEDGARGPWFSFLFSSTGRLPDSPDRLTQ